MGAKLSLIKTFIISPLFSANIQATGRILSKFQIHPGYSRGFIVIAFCSFKMQKGKNLISTSQEKGVKNDFDKYFK